MFVLGMRENFEIWFQENWTHPEHPHVTEELYWDSPKVNVWCSIMCNRINGPFFFNKVSIAAKIYVNLLTEYVSPQLDNLQPTIILSKMVHQRIGDCILVGF